jgi:hypothetical protein
VNHDSLDPQAVCEEIAAAFRDVPRPERYYDRAEEGDEESGPGEDEAKRLDYLVDKTWQDIAGDLKYLVLHEADDFLWMTEECFFYFFPAYLLATVNHNFIFVDGLTYGLLGVLTPIEIVSWPERHFSYLSPRLTPMQKRAVAHWLQLQLERDRERSPAAYEPAASQEEALETEFQVAFDRWRQWA